MSNLKRGRSPNYWLGHLKICRFDHWIKNIFVIPGVLLALASESFSHVNLTGHLFLGLCAIGLIASSNYVINEVLDAPFDRKNPKKMNRPVPLGQVKISLALVQWVALMIAGLWVASLVSRIFVFILAGLWLMAFLYNVRPFRAKDLPYLDVLCESINNPLRLLAGWFIVTPAPFRSTGLLISYWLLGAYFMALKRYAELKDLDNPVIASDYRKSFCFYNENRLLVSAMFYASASMILLGAFIMEAKTNMVVAFPLVAWVMAVYLGLALKPKSPVQEPERLYREPQLMISVVLCSVVMIGLLFWQISVLDVLARVFNGLTH